LVKGVTFGSNVVVTSDLSEDIANNPNKNSKYYINTKNYFQGHYVKNAMGSVENLIAGDETYNNFNMQMMKHSSTVNNFDVLNRGSNLSSYGNNGAGNAGGVGNNETYSRNPIEIYRDQIRK
jgi:hypothetical protein